MSALSKASIMIAIAVYLAHLALPPDWVRLPIALACGFCLSAAWHEFKQGLPPA